MSDSVEFVIGASQIIGKTAGVLAMIVFVCVTLSPVIELLVIGFLTGIVSAIAESLNVDDKTVKMIDGFSEIYKTVAGVVIAASITFVISIAVILSLMGKIIS